MTDPLDIFPPEQREFARRVRELILGAMPAGYAESSASGMRVWTVPLERYPRTYNGQPLAYVAMAVWKTGGALYLTGVYQDPAAERRLRDAYAAAGRRIDLGKSCLRFKRWDDLLPEAVAAEIASLPVDAFIAGHEAARARGGPCS